MHRVLSMPYDSSTARVLDTSTKETRKTERTFTLRLLHCKQPNLLFRCVCLAKIVLWGEASDIVLCSCAIRCLAWLGKCMSCRSRLEAEVAKVWGSLRENPTNHSRAATNTRTATVACAVLRAAEKPLSCGMWLSEIECRNAPRREMPYSRSERCSQGINGACIKCRSIGFCSHTWAIFRCIAPFHSFNIVCWRTIESTF